MKKNIIPIQALERSPSDPSQLCSFDLETISGPTKPLIHQGARFLFITGGAGTITIQNTPYKLQPGTVVSIMPWQITEVTAVSSLLQYCIVTYSFDIINQIIKSFYHFEECGVDIIQDMASSPLVYCNDKQRAGMQEVFSCIRDEVGVASSGQVPAAQPLQSVYLTNRLVELVVLYLRIGKDNHASFNSGRLAIDPSDILPYMYNHLREKITLKELSKRFYISESTIRKYISQHTGLSFFDLLNEMRVGKTVNFLLYTDLTLDELAEILGYVDASHISKVFAARMGVKANEYRKTYQKISAICGVKESRLAYSLVNYMYRNYAEPITPKSVARENGISVAELQKTLLYQVERSFEDFIHYLRVNAASELLLTTNKTIVEIAIEVGYHTSKTLTRNFLKLRQMTPSQFRWQVQLQLDKHSLLEQEPDEEEQEYE